MPCTKKTVSTAGPRIDVHVQNLLCSLFNLNENPSLQEINALRNKHGLAQTSKQIRKWFCNHRRPKPSKKQRDKYEQTRQANMSEEKRDAKRRYLRQYHANRKQDAKQDATAKGRALAPLNSMSQVQDFKQHATPSKTVQAPPKTMATPQNLLLGEDSANTPPPPCTHDVHNGLQPMQLSFDDDDFDVDSFLTNFPW